MREKSDGSLIIISHQERILNIADRIIVIADGMIVEEGEKNKILPGILSDSAVCRTLMEKL